VTEDTQPQLHAHHPRTWRENAYVYPVISRRSGGLSIGVNLNPDKACNFDCIYCQVDRTVPPAVRKVDPDRLRGELQSMIERAVNGELFASPPFDRVPIESRQIRDIAFSGDGEPTTSPQFLDAIRIAAGIRRQYGLDNVKLVLITDAAYLHKPLVKAGLEVMDAHNGEIWAKLDAGTEEYYRKVNRPNVPLSQVLDNIREAARQRPIVIQSLWMRIHGEGPPPGEIDAFAHRLREIVEAGGRIRLVQVYTVARQTAEPYVEPLTDAELETIAARVRSIVDLPISTYG
jgi:wyosine [tRNA(Phe)-imidazoG37] synthetase (radical SAM superfamily)